MGMVEENKLARGIAFGSREEPGLVVAGAGS